MQNLCSVGSRTSPSPSVSVDLADLGPVCGPSGHASRNTSSEPEAEGRFPPLMPIAYEALADVTHKTLIRHWPRTFVRDQ